MILVYSLGGSILAGQDPAGLKMYAESLLEIAREHQVYVVVGGGRIARDYIGRARGVGASEALCDTIGIAATRMNSMLLIAALNGAAPARIPESTTRLSEAARNCRIVVSGRRIAWSRRPTPSPPC